MPKARAAAQKALELDGNLAEARVSLGFVRFAFDWDWTGAERELREAIRLNPSYSVAHHIYAVLLMTVGRPDESVAEAQRALDVDPLSVPINLILCSIQFHDAIVPSLTRWLSTGARAAAMIASASVSSESHR